jgi:hypothetical protein
MSKLTQDMEYVKTYLDNLLILSNNNFKDHLLKLEMVLSRLSTTGMRVSASKSKFFAEQIEYLRIGYWITRQGIQPVHSKVEAIINIQAFDKIKTVIGTEVFLSYPDFNNHSTFTLMHLIISCVQ